MLDGESAALENWLRPRLVNAREVGIRTGFLTVPGVNAVAAAVLATLNRGGDVRVVAGGQGEQLDVDALRTLKGILDAGGDRGSLHVVNAPIGLHNAKTY